MEHPGLSTLMKQSITSKLQEHTVSSWTWVQFVSHSNWMLWVMGLHDWQIWQMFNWITQIWLKHAEACSKAGETEDRFLNHNISQLITARPATLPQNLLRERHLRFKSPRWSQSSWRRLEAVGMGSAVLGKGTCWTLSKTLKSYLIHISDTCIFCNHKGILFWMKSREQSVAWEWGLHVRRSLSLGMMCHVHNIPWPWIGFGLVSVTVRQDHS